jgi:hypothetical protein
MMSSESMAFPAVLFDAGAETVAAVLRGRLVAGSFE